jgi:tetratricopeptide (TPR) repeat protein
MLKRFSSGLLTMALLVPSDTAIWSANGQSLDLPANGKCTCLGAEQIQPAAQPMQKPVPTSNIMRRLIGGDWDYLQAFQQVPVAHYQGPDLQLLTLVHYRQPAEEEFELPRPARTSRQFLFQFALFMQDSRYAEAEVCALKAKDLQPSNAAAFEALCDAAIKKEIRGMKIWLIMCEGFTMSSLERDVAAITITAEECRLFSAQRFYEIGKQCAVQGDLAIARNCFDEAIRLAGNDKYGRQAQVALAAMERTFNFDSLQQTFDFRRFGHLFGPEGEVDDCEPEDFIVWGKQSKAP